MRNLPSSKWLSRRGGIRTEPQGVSAEPFRIPLERSHFLLRLSTRRFTRLTNDFSKKWKNHEADLAVWLACYNVGRKHITLKETPAMASGLEDHIRTIRELIEESAKF